MAEGGVSYRVVDGAVGWIELTRPAVSNAIDLPVSRAFGTAVGRAASDAVRAVLVSGAGRNFCVGGDIPSVARAVDRAAYLRDLADDFGRALRCLADLRKPVFSAVQGAVAGAGLAIVLSSDLVIADRTARFLTAYAGLALTPDCGVSYLLPRVVGQQRALELALTRRVLSAQEALDWGLVTKLVDDGTAAERALNLARRLADGDALAQAKRLIRSSWEVSRVDSAADEVDTIARAAVSQQASALIDSIAGVLPLPHQHTSDVVG